MLASRARDLWIEELRIRSCSPATLTAYQSHTREALRHMAEHLKVEPGELELSMLDRDCVIHALSEYRSRVDGRTGKKRDRSPVSVGHRLGALKAFLAWCVMTEKVEKNVAAMVAAPKTPQRVPKALPVDACQRLVTAAGQSRFPERDQLLLLCGLAMGLRLAEIAGLRLSSFSPSVTAPTHLKVLGKGSKERTVPVPANVRAALASYLKVRSERLEEAGFVTDALFLSARPYERDGERRMDATRDGLAQVFERTLVACDLKAPGLRVHTTRHSFATAGISSRVFGIEEVQVLLGHSSIATTQIYLNVDPERLSASAERHPLALME